MTARLERVSKVQATAYSFRCVASALMISFGLDVNAAPQLESNPTSRRPSIHAAGIQFDLNRAFVTDLAPDGRRLFFTTQDGGNTWHSLIVRDTRNTLLNAEDLKIAYVNQVSASVFYDGSYLTLK